jgi:hypothetical protein
LPVASDLSYIGSSQNINLAGFSSDATCWVRASRWRCGSSTRRAGSSYIFGGAGWRQLSIKRQNVFGTGFLDYDNQASCPSARAWPSGRSTVHCSTSTAPAA